MKRMAIFLFYDFENIVDDYVLFFLNELSSVTNKIIIVTNGFLKEEQKGKLEYYGKVYERENTGYDAGGYKDAFHLIGREELLRWDELVLVNDTFYGPFYPLKEVFDIMAESEVDFWGLTRSIGNKEIPMHIESYFITFRKKIINLDEFWLFWENMDYYSEIMDVIWNFEIGLSQLLMKKGFKHAVFTDFQKNDYLTDKFVVPYINFAYELIAQSKFPVLKRKAFVLFNYSNVMKALDYIKSNYNYDTNLIFKHLDRVSNEMTGQVFKKDEIFKFCKKYKEIFIYGKGQYGQGINDYLRRCGIDIEGFLVTSKKSNEKDDVTEFNDFELRSNRGIIIALGRKNFEEVYPNVAAKIPEEQLLLPVFD